MATQSESIGPESIRQESEVTYADEPFGQDVQEEATQELDRVERHHA